MLSLINNGPPFLYFFSKKVKTGELFGNSNQQFITGTDILMQQGFTIVPVQLYIWNGTANVLDAQLFNAGNQPYNEIVSMVNNEGSLSNMAEAGNITYRWLTTPGNVSSMYIQFTILDPSPDVYVYIQLLYTAAKLYP
jgi:hypothetical protein